MRVAFVDFKAQYATLRSDVIKMVWDVLEDQDLQHGPNLRAFEAEFAAYCGIPHAVGVGSGVDGLILALRACGVRGGDEVITAANGPISTTEAILRVGAVPIYVDVDPETYTLDPTTIAPAVTRDTRAIVPVHLYGLMADMDPILEIAQHFGLVVVEDAREAHGAEYHAQRAGGLGHAAAFSFSVARNLSAYGDAGAVTTTSPSVAAEVRRLQNHGLPGDANTRPATFRYEREDIGLDSRLDELQAAVLRVKLRRLDAWNACRRAHAETYRRLLQDLPIVPPVERSDSVHVYYRYAIRTRDRERVRRALADRGVETFAHYPAPARFEVDSTVGRVAGRPSVAEAVAGDVIFLPIYPELTPDQVSYVAECLRAAVGTAPVRAMELV